MQTMIFCSNQITVAIAMGLARTTHREGKCVVLFMPGRCDVSQLTAAGISCIPYSRWALIDLLARSGWFHEIEACVPHFRLGNFIKLFARLCRKISLIDDGLDTWRDKPRNVEPELFDAGTDFYTFDYDIPLGSWLSKFNVRIVSSLTAIADVSKREVDFINVSRLIIESPPLDRVAKLLSVCQESTCVVKHSNPHKRTFEAEVCCVLDGGDIALERSLRTFSGELVVGESMVAVYALRYASPSCRIVVYVKNEDIDNLRPFKRLIDSCARAELVIC